MTINRVFLNWNQAALPQAADYLIQRFRSGSFVDMSNVIAVVPGGRAGRRLNELLIERLDGSDCSFFPVQTITVGQLPEKLYKPALPFATQMTQHLAWAKAMQQLSKKELRHIVLDAPTDASDARWVELGIMLQKQHRELAGDGLNFESVLECGEQIDNFNETERWRALADVQRKYLNILDDLQLWDRQTARLVALEKQECQTDCQIVLIATADMNLVMRQMLDQVSDQVTSLVFSPEEFRDRFDEHGCIDPDAWQRAQISLDSSKIAYVGSPADQGIAVLRAMQTLEGRYAANQITVGVPNKSLIPNLQVALKKANVPCRWGPGRSIEASRPIRLLRCVIDYLCQGDFANLAELMRHPDVGHWLRVRHFDAEKLLVEWDQFQSEHLQASAHKKFVAAKKELQKSKQTLDDFLRPLNGKHRIPAEWSDVIIEFVNALYHHQTINIEDDHGRMTLTACDAIRDGLEQLKLIPEELQQPVASDRAILMLLSQLKNQRCPALPDDSAAELLGWLELTLDDAPVKIVTNFNEGTIPTSIDADLFLPNQLRSELKIDDNRRLFARDVYATSLVSASSQLHLIVGQRQHDGNPILPSRLLFAANHNTVLERSMKFFDEESDDSVLIQNEGLPEEHGFFVPAPLPLTQPIDTINVTDFRSYLSCRYRYYLNRIWKLRESRDDAVELDGAAFGSLAHDVLEQFGKSELREATNPDEIQAFLNSALSDHVRHAFGSNIRPAVKIQVEQLRSRLHAFAKKQADRRRQGWRIIATEKSYEADFDVDNQPIKLKGRIDRIDQHEDSGRLAVLDYKTSEGGMSPDKVHRKSDEWIDLQLPLYRHLVKGMADEKSLELGFILLPNDTAKVDFEMADWSRDQLKAADEIAIGVVRDIRKQNFWPPVYPPPAFSESTASICQDHVFDRTLQTATENSVPANHLKLANQESRDGKEAV